MFFDTGLSDSGELGEEPEPNDPADDGDEDGDEDEEWEEEEAEDDPTVEPHEEPMDDDKDSSWLTNWEICVLPFPILCTLSPAQWNKIIYSLKIPI